jgi:lysophospholipase L1-like esterase
LGLLEPGDSVLFIGDSITDAFRKPEEINNAYQLGSGYAFIIAARLTAEFPEAGFHFTNRGISGQRVVHLHERWDGDCLDLSPDVLSLLVGVNSTLHKFQDHEQMADADLDGFSASYDELLRRFRTRQRNARIVLCEPFMLPCGLGTPEMVENVRERGRRVERLAERYQAVFVPFQAAFDRAMKQAPAEYWAYDGIHPTAAGFWLLAETWLDHVVRQAMRSVPRAARKEF